MRPLLVNSFVTRVTTPVGNGSDGLLTARFRQISVVHGVEDTAAVLGTDQGQDDDIGVDTAHEDADDNTILVPLDLALGWEREAFAHGGFDGRGGRGDEVAELIGSADDEGAEGAGRQFHEMDGDDAPGALHAELLEEGGRDDGLATGEGVWVQKRATEDGDDDDGEPTAKDLRRVADECTASNGTQIGDYLSDGDGIRREVVLVPQHRRV